MIGLIVTALAIDAMTNTRTVPGDKFRLEITYLCDAPSFETATPKKALVTFYRVGPSQYLDAVLQDPPSAITSAPVVPILPHAKLHEVVVDREADRMKYILDLRDRQTGQPRMSVTMTTSGNHRIAALSLKPDAKRIGELKCEAIPMPPYRPQWAKDSAQ